MIDSWKIILQVLTIILHEPHQHGAGWSTVQTCQSLTYSLQRRIERSPNQLNPITFLTSNQNVGDHHHESISPL